LIKIGIKKTLVAKAVLALARKGRPSGFLSLLEAKDGLDPLLLVELNTLSLKPLCSFESMRRIEKDLCNNVLKFLINLKEVILGEEEYVAIGD
jgi:predicted GNAT family acetyltransferase